MEFKGTKGEWKVRILKTGFETEIACGEIRIAEVKHYNNGKEDDEENYFKYDPLPKEGLKNAKLIAAAPELLEALQNVTNQFKDLLNSLYGQNINVVGWHLNGEHETFDSFIDDNNDGGLELAEKAINKALN
jgi:hypothetical protein